MHERLWRYRISIRQTRKAQRCKKSTSKSWRDGMHLFCTFLCFSRCCCCLLQGFFLLKLHLFDFNAFFFYFLSACLDRVWNNLQKLFMVRAVTFGSLKENPPTCRRVREVDWFILLRFHSLRMVHLLHFTLRLPCFALLRLASLCFAQLHFASLSFAVLRFASLSFAVFRLTSRCPALHRFASLNFAVFRFASCCFALLRCASLCFALLRFASLCFASLCFPLLRFASLCFA